MKAQESNIHPTFQGCHYSHERNCLLDAQGNRVQIRPKSLAVFQYLASHPRKVISKQELFDEVWTGVIVTDDALGKCIAEIRQVLGDNNRTVLQSVSGLGYLLEPDEPLTTDNVPVHGDKKPLMTSWLLLLPVVIFFGLGAYFSERSDKAESRFGLESEFGTPTISVIADQTTQQVQFIKQVEQDTRVALSRYRSIVLVDDDSSDFNLHLSTSNSSDTPGISVELKKTSNNQIVFAELLQSNESIDNDVTSSPVTSQAKMLGIRIAGMIASPGGGAISRYLLESGKDKTADQLTRAECYAYGYDCTNCSGELDSITKKAQACLTRILKEDPKDARAWGLQSTIYAHQYQWSTALAEPERTSLSARAHLPALAIEAANKAEQYSDGTDTSVYWGMAQAYSSACQVDKLRTVVDRGLQINPDDPSLLAAFGNWIAYAGHWDEGVAMVNRALEIEPRYFQSWWLFSIAKRHYFNADYEQALDAFQRAYNERNWLSHLQLAYTLPYLDRMDEAIEERKAFERLLPGVTIENVLQFYKIYCFDNTFLAKVDWALNQAGLPSRGSANSYDNIKPPEAKVTRINGFDLEYMDVGSGMPIIFVHGSISDYRAWSYFQNPISDQHRFISYSLRYRGSQPWTDEGEQFGIDTDAKDLIAFVESLNSGPVHTVSWSRGGRVSALAAVKRPDLFLGAIHFEPIMNSLAHDTTDPTILAARDTFFARFDDSDQKFKAGKPEEAVAIILENVFELSRGRFETEIMPLRRMNRDSADAMTLQIEKDNDAAPVITCDLLATTTTPTLVLGGANTNAWWKHVVERFHTCIPNSEFALVSGVNHDGPIRRPEKITELILEFVNRYQ